MIVFVLGTSAEAIKVQPVTRRLQKRGVPFEIWATYQHTDALDKALDSLQMPRPVYQFARGDRGRPIERPAQMLSWLSSSFNSLRRDRKMLRARLGDRGLLIVHGDTVTTVFGALAAKFLKVPSAHIEAGLRSGSLLRPFPEEIDRRIVGKLANLHFTPNEKARQNLRNKDAVNTEHNTAIDGVLDTLTDEGSTVAGTYGLVLLHRYELISQPDFVRQTISLLNELSPVKLVVLTDVFSGGPVNDAIAALKSEKLVPREKLPYPEFVNAMAGAEFIFTDSGGIQQEAGLLGVPTMLHRKVTESPDGMGRNIVLSEWNPEKVREFFSNYKKLRYPLDQPKTSPSDIIVDALDRRGYLPASS